MSDTSPLSSTDHHMPTQQPPQQPASNEYVSDAVSVRVEREESEREKERGGGERERERGGWRRKVERKREREKCGEK